MYGTVARVRVKKGALETLRQLVEHEAQQVMPGYHAQYVFQMDSDPHELYLVAIFDSRESYFANANSPEQDARYREMVQYMESEPEWHDGELIYPISE